MAEEVREHLAALGLRSLEEAVGRVDLLDTLDAIDHFKASGLDLSSILAEPRNVSEMVSSASPAPPKRLVIS